MGHIYGQNVQKIFYRPIHARPTEKRLNQCRAEDIEAVWYNVFVLRAVHYGWQERGAIQRRWELGIYAMSLAIFGVTETDFNLFPNKENGHP